MLALLLLIANAQVQVMAYNVLCCGGEPKETVKTIADVDADLVLLQEVTPKWRERLEKHFAKQYPYRRYAARAGAYGYAILSKTPISPIQLVTVRGGPPAAACTITSTKIAACSLHLKSARSAFQEKRASMMSELDANMRLRTHQWTKLLAWLETNASDMPQILAGDTNTPDFDPVLGTLTEKHIDGARALTPFPKHTYPRGGLFQMRLDYVLVSGAEVTSLDVLDAGGSDHLPVVAQVRVNQPGR